MNPAGLIPLVLLALFTATAAAADEPPLEWIDPDTGHRVIRISTEPGSASLYFHQNTCTPEGDKMIFNTPGGIAAVDLTTLGKGAPRVELVVSNASALAMAFRTREVYFRRRGGPLMACSAAFGMLRARQFHGLRNG